MTERLRDLLDSLDFPMVIVTAADGVERSGCLVGFTTRCSIDPTRWFVCISKRNHTFGVAERTRVLAVHFLREDQHDLAELFGARTGDALDKFRRCAWREGPGGVPILAGCDWIAGNVIERWDVGDHVGHLLEVIDGGREHAGAAQLHAYDVRDIAAGHVP